MKLLVCLLGLVLVVEGLPYFAFPEKMQGWLRQLSEIPPGHLRWIGLASTLFGLALCYLGRRSGLLP
ncbi:DUF2065 domain-containing protein [Dissulfurirhabdus thermomarina]|uniref:DUF2065 domain-containing protein n=1 Tax=Dissulfurirhabdus thermomarina TaxID=1765737 RepID=A0A6N9TMK0_DISTH|nr:DUF2065 domain-containing protein [Dissulfurirhabdus thermomarina]NDY42512.1 DUF2065 domain-containing protein [Dissulfurirhabdus thermomarina]NMX24199.1 DUF2065 domain-containing protein [Dissulfurirhabdus thermomarina]